MCLKTAGCVANNVDTDQMLHFAASDLGLRCCFFSGLFCLNTYGKYGIVPKYSVKHN